VLDLQKVLIGREKYTLQRPDGDVNVQALGYVFGFFDALLQNAKLDIRSYEGEAAVYSLLCRLFTAEVLHTGTYVAHLKQMSDDPEMMNGVMLGGKQAVDWLRYQTPPVRWVLCFSPELARLAEERDRSR
jgi:hypothetical protein